MTKNRFDENRNFIVFSGLLLTVATALWYAFQDIRIGWSFVLLFTVPTVVWLVMLQLIDEKTKKSIISKLKIPFTTSTPVAAVMFVLGEILILSLALLPLKQIFGFTFTDYLQPLAIEKVNLFIQQTSAQVAISSSSAAQLWNTLFNAPYIEEFIFGFIAIHLFYPVIKTMYSSLTKKELSHNITLFITFILVGASFAGLHVFNSTYITLTAYIIAALFRIVLSAMIYYAGVYLSFTLGLHQMNNLIWYIREYGINNTMEALLSFTGAILLIQHIIIIAIILNNFPSIQKMLADVRRQIKKARVGI